ncbi:V-type ATP synthase subunit D [Kiritimatiella glycovorans]|uniref:V-type ATP synthase subunit D n=1 Tax=Kiritimatiella glycovorans TaxID=1307763 RepID=A0A0G3EDH3_9BACT|nr:V-type ATP synthase subunit D [Kiritimatiella glycovorans]AKJ64526.1 V-type ATP synthase subunit D [Kiritimatiella glycovorans]
MAKIKYTKNELKEQRDALARFERYLPTLQLKKQQLQNEIQRLDAEIEAKGREEEKVRSNLSHWIQLFGEPFDFSPYLEMHELRIEAGNIAGVNIPVLGEIGFVERRPDFERTPAWVDEGIAMLRKLIRLRVERNVLEEQQQRIRDELRVTNQRVNLFEKVKIPECRENIRTIRIFLGDQQTAAVARSKIAKAKSAG